MTEKGENTPKLRRALAMGLWTGAGTLIPFWRIPRGPLAVVGGSLAAVVAAAGLVLAQDRAEREAAVQREPLPEVGPLRRIGAPVLTGALVGGVAAGALWVSSVTDELSEKLVARLGARRPRIALAAVAGVCTAVLEYLDSGAGKQSSADISPAAVPAGADPAPEKA